MGAVEAMQLQPLGAVDAVVGTPLFGGAVQPDTSSRWSTVRNTARSAANSNCLVVERIGGYPLSGVGISFFTLSKRKGTRWVEQLPAPLRYPGSAISQSRKRGSAAAGKPACSRSPRLWR
jgi:hypothetical protein